MSGHLLVGIDSGGSRTNVEAWAADGHVRLLSYEVEQVLSSAVHQSKYAAVLQTILAPLEARWRSELAEYDQATIFLSAAGFTSVSRDDYRLALRGVLPSVFDGAVAAIGVANDAVTLLLGHDCSGVVIAGTGSNVVIRTDDGHFHQSGGYGWVASDEGSGFWVGLLAIRQACTDLQDENESVILLRLRQRYGIAADDMGPLIAKFQDLCLADQRTHTEIAQFASFVCAAAERGDESSQNIVKAEAERLADNVARSVRRHFPSHRLAHGVTLLQNGGLMASDVYRTAFESQVALRLLSGQENTGGISWMRVTTGLQAAVTLAGRLTDWTESIMATDREFRPVVVRSSRA